MGGVVQGGGRGKRCGRSVPSCCGANGCAGEGGEGIPTAAAAAALGGCSMLLLLLLLLLLALQKLLLLQRCPGG